MDETPAAQSRGVDDLLALRPAPPGDNRLREALLHRTTALLRRRRRLKRAALVAAMAACFGAGMMTMRFCTPASETDPHGLVAIPPERSADKRHDPGPPAPPTKKSDEAFPKVAETARALEWQALDRPERRAELYRQAGDRYLEENDVASALRCYRGALAAGSDKDCTISVDDNWLLMAAKQERQKEKRNAQNGG